MLTIRLHGMDVTASLSTTEIGNANGDYLPNRTQLHWYVRYVRDIQGTCQRHVSLEL